MFVALGASASSIGGLINEKLWILTKIAGVAVILFGLHTMGLLKINALYRQAQIDVKRKPAGPLGAFVVGLAFAFGWTPCIGPILGSILALAAQEGTVTHGATLLAVYSFGLGVPFLATSLAVNRFFARVQEGPQVLPDDRDRRRPADGRHRRAPGHRPLLAHRPLPAEVPALVLMRTSLAGLRPPRRSCVCLALGLLAASAPRPPRRTRRRRRSRSARSPSPASSRPTRSSPTERHADWPGNDDGEPPDSFSVPRARVGLSGALTSKITWYLVGDFANLTNDGRVLRDAYLQFTATPQFAVRFGQMVAPFSLERLTTYTKLELIDRSVIGASMVPSRDFGLMVFNTQPWRGWVTYGAAIINGTGQNRADDNNAKDVVGRVATKVPHVDHLTVGVNAQTGEQPAGDAAAGRRRPQL